MEKGAPTIIFTPNGDALINSSGNPSLAKFGTGDVLTGTIAGLLSQQNDIEKAVVSAVYIHGLTADLLVASKTEYSLMAGELLNYLPNTINFLRNSIVWLFREEENIFSVCASNSLLDFAIYCHIFACCTCTFVCCKW